MRTSQPAIPDPGQAESAQTVADRRAASRTRTIYRIAHVRSATDAGLARVRNISDAGMRLAIGIAVAAGDTLEVSLSDDLAFEGKVAWADNGECGLEFLRSVDSNEVLRRVAEDTRLGRARAPRLPVSHPAVVTSERGVHVTRLHDISQRGMKLANDGKFTPGLSVKVAIGPGIERRGIVRWVRDDFAGVMLTEPFSIEELGSMRAL